MRSNLSVFAGLQEERSPKYQQSHVSEEANRSPAADLNQTVSVSCVRTVASGCVNEDCATVSVVCPELCVRMKCVCESMIIRRQLWAKKTRVTYLVSRTCRS